MNKNHSICSPRAALRAVRMPKRSETAASSEYETFNDDARADREHAEYFYAKYLSRMRDI